MRLTKAIIRWSIVLVVGVGIPAGCQTVGDASGSQRILTQHLLFIPGQGPLHVTWEARDLTISFKGRVSQNLLTLEGQIDITGRGIQHFSMLDHLVVDIYLTDSAGNVLGKHKFYSTDNSSIDNRIPRRFKRSFELPKGTSHIAFGYDGTAREGGAKVLRKKGAAIEHGFQHSPFR
jgi:hypothetical protein